MMNITKAELWKLDPSGKEVAKFPVQFNPESLKVSFQNQIVPPQNAAPAATSTGGGTPAPAPAATDQNAGTAATQFVGKGTTKLTVQLWFDVTGEIPTALAAANSPESADVRELTRKVVDLITPQQDPKDKTKYIPPGVKFVWGSFLFEGIMESLEQSLEFFSPEGIPLRASMALSLSQQSIDYKPSQKKPTMGNTPATPGAGGAPSGGPTGSNPLTQASAGLSLQSMAASIGRGDDWKGIALANEIENPRLLVPGQLIDMNVSTPAAPSVRFTTSLSSESFGVRFGN